MNKVFLIGRATKDPELKYIPSTGTAVARFSLAVNRDFKTKDGERKADFFNVVAWGKTAEFLANYLGKGRLVAIHGRIENRSYESDGQKRYMTEIIAENIEILEWGDKKTDEPEGFRMVDDDDIPF